MKNTVSTFFMFLIISSLLWIAPSKSQSSDVLLETEISISELTAYAYENNPEINAAKQAWKAAVEKQKVVTGYPDPQISVTYFPKPIETLGGPHDWSASVSQMIPFPGKLSKAGEVAETDAMIAKLDMNKAVRDTNYSIKQAYYELLYIQEARKITQLNANLLDGLRKIGETKYGRESEVLSDLVKSQSQIAQLSYDIILLDELELTEITKLNGLLNRSPDAPLGRAQKADFRPLTYSLNELYELASKNREEIRAAQVEIKKAEVQMDLASYENLPEFRVGFFYAGIGEPDEAVSLKDTKEDSYGVQFGMSVPLWFGKNTGRTASARASVQKTRADKNNLVNQTYTQIRTLYFKLTNAERLVTLYEEQILPQALESVHKAETLFREGKGSFSDFVEIQKTTYSFQLALARARADYGKALAALEQATGVNLTN
ncbi:MAG: TolC family protein [Desulfobacterales bacterium]